MGFSRQPKRARRQTTIVAPKFYYLPDDCWEHVFKFFIGDYNNNSPYFQSLSLVSKQFLSITNRFIFSLKAYNRGNPDLGGFLDRLFHRFTNLTSLDLTHYSCCDLDALLCQISRFPLKLTSLDLSHLSTIPTIGLRAFCKNITTLTSLKCSNMKFINSSDLFLIAECFPLLEELDMSHPKKSKNCSNFCNGVETLSLALFRLNKINLSGHDYINDKSLFHLFKNCKLLQEVIMFDCNHISNDGIASALCERPTLRSLSFTTTFESGNLAMLFALVRKYPSLSEIRMEYTFKSGYGIDNSISSMGSVACPQLKSLRLARYSWLRDENIKMFTSVFPNLQMLDLNECDDISEEGIFHVLRRCGNIRHLNLAHCFRVKLIGLNFEVPNLEVLNLSYTSVDDETLYVISKNCRGLLKLVLKHCHNVTQKGVKHVIENCTKLREINLWFCDIVHASIVDNMVFSRPSLRKIVVPSSLYSYLFYRRRRELLLRYGCLVCHWNALLKLKLWNVRCFLFSDLLLWELTSFFYVYLFISRCIGAW